MQRNTMKKKIDNESRHYCVYCGSKLYASNMIHFRIPLLKRTFWACKDCFCANILSSQEDKLEVSKNLVLLISYKLEN